MSLKELELAFAMADSGTPGDTVVFVSRSTGRSFVRSEANGIDEVPPGSDHSSDLVPLPRRENLGLGRELALEFVDTEAPDMRASTEAIFGEGDGLSAFKALMGEIGHLEGWYDFEAERVTRALRDWCAREGVPIEG